MSGNSTTADGAEQASSFSEFLQQMRMENVNVKEEDGEILFDLSNSYGCVADRLFVSACAVMSRVRTRCEPVLRVKFVMLAPRLSLPLLFFWICGDDTFAVFDIS